MTEQESNLNASPRYLQRMAERLSRFLERFHRGGIPAGALTIILACLVGIAGGYGAVFFTYLIDLVTDLTVWNVLQRAGQNRIWMAVLCVVPALGLLVVSAFTRRFAPEAQGHGVPEVITAVARRDGVIRPRVALVKILASGVCIGTGGSIGREGPIVQIGSTLGSMGGQLFRLSARNIKVLVAAGAAAGISATFNAPLAGVIFASEIILGSFAVESLTPIVIASVLADVVQTHVGEHGLNPVFPQVTYTFYGTWSQIPSYVVLGLFSGLGAVGFTKMLYAIEDFTQKWFPKWWARALVMGGLVGLSGVFYPADPPVMSDASHEERESHTRRLPPLMGVGYGVVDHALHLDNEDAEGAGASAEMRELAAADQASQDAHAPANSDLSKKVKLDPAKMWSELWWLLPLVFLKPVMTSITLAGGGSGGVFAPSLFIGATLGACFGLICNLVLPQYSANPGLYAIVGMGAVVAGTTHGILSAILIVYEMTNDYRIIPPIMVAAGLASIVARVIDADSIYEKKISRRGESIARGHQMHHLEHIMVRDVMVRDFPTVRDCDNLDEIVRVARAHAHFESLPVMNRDGELVGIIRPEDLHRVLDTDIASNMLYAEDIALTSSISVSPDANLLEAMRDFGSRDVELLPVEFRSGKTRRIVGLLLRSDVMGRYRQEMLRGR
jgi:CIC family chloride channel protein